MTNAEKKARNLIANRSTEQIINDFELTEMLTITPELATVRGWYMEELEKRNAEAFEKWIDNYDDSPRKFFLN